MKRNGDYFHNFNTPVFSIYKIKLMIAKDWFYIYKLCFFRMKVGLKYKLKNMKKYFSSTGNFLFFISPKISGNPQKPDFLNYFFPPKNSSYDCFFAD